MDKSVYLIDLGIKVVVTHLEFGGEKFPAPVGLSELLEPTWAYNVDRGVNMFIFPSKEVVGSIIAPGDFSKAYDRTGDVNNAIRDVDDVSMSINDLINYSMHLHYELINDYPEEISNTFCYYVLALVNGEVMHFEGRTEL